jgi:hypothetical protein
LSTAVASRFESAGAVAYQSDHALKLPKSLRVVRTEAGAPVRWWELEPHVDRENSPTVPNTSVRLRSPPVSSVTRGKPARLQRQSGAWTSHGAIPVPSSNSRQSFSTS